MSELSNMTIGVGIRSQYGLSCRYPLRKGQRKEPAPHKIQITTGAIHVALTRGFVDFALHNQVAKDFLNWLNDTHIPDESYFASLHVNPQLGVPGAFTGKSFSSLHDSSRTHN